MTLDKAIKELESAIPPREAILANDLLDAMRIGVEALKRLQDNRRDPEFDHWLPLPGETED
jgi:hypothetical protein